VGYLDYAVNVSDPPVDHYIPRLLLRRFLGKNGALWVCDLRENSIRTQSVKETGAEPEFDTVWRNGTPEREVAELFSPHFEAPVGLALKALHEFKGLNQENILAIINFAAFLFRRTPAAIERKQTDLSHLGSCHSSSRDGSFLLSLQSIPSVVESLTAMRWAFLYVPRDAADLVLGDNPVIRRGFGMGTEIWLPLGRRIIAHAGYGDASGYGVLWPYLVHRINIATFRRARRFIFAGNRQVIIDTMSAGTVSTPDGGQVP